MHPGPGRTLGAVVWRRRFLAFLLLAIVGSGGVRTGPARAGDVPFTGSFGGEIDGVPHRLLIFSDSPGNYDGELLADGLRLPVSGQRFGDHMMGRAGFPDDAFAFRARVLGAVLLIERQSGPPLRFFRETD